MRLYEEYLKRHSLKVPVAKHISEGCIILRDDNGRCYQMLSFRSEGDAHRPNSYNVRTMNVQHDSATASGHIFRNAGANDKILQWDEYEEYVTKIARKGNFIRGEKEVILAAWEIFVYANDSAFSKYASSEDFFKTLDSELSVEDRFKAHVTFLPTIQKEPSFGLWRNEIGEHLKKYCHWLGELADSLPKKVD